MRLIEFIRLQPFSVEKRELPLMDLSRFCAAPSARLGRFPFESDRAFPTQC